jgi:hypothetical protein
MTPRLSSPSPSPVHPVLVLDTSRRSDDNFQGLGRRPLPLLHCIEVQVHVDNDQVEYAFTFSNCSPQSVRRFPSRSNRDSLAGMGSAGGL